MTMKLSRILLSTALILVAFAGIFLSQSAPASAANDWYVATTGSDITGNGSSGLPWQHIQFAVDNATVLDGDTINIAAGNYVEQVTIEKSLTLTGPATSPYAVIVAPVVRGGQIGLYDYIVDADGGHNVRLVNLVINANDTVISAPGAAIYTGVHLSDISGAGAGLFNCSILGFGGTTGNQINGVSIFGLSSLIIDGCGIRDFKYRGIYSTGAATSLTITNCDINASTATAGVKINGGTAVVSWNKITGGAMGVCTDHTSNLTINDNEILSQFDYGVYCQNTTSGAAVIQHNLIHGVNSGAGYGIYSDAGVGNGSIVNNEIYGCKIAINLDWALSIWSVTQNLIRNCSVTGVRFESPITTFSQNTIFACVTGINVQANVLTAHCNAILGNTTAGLALHNNGVFDVTNNYWGANSGPNVDSAGPGSGDKITTNAYTALTYSPWVVINLTPSPATLDAGSGASTITMDCTKNSAGAATGCVIPVLVNAVLTTNFGSFSGAATVTRPLIAGLASAPLSSGAAGTATVTGSIAEMPTILVTTHVVFTTPPPPPPDNPFVGTIPQSSGGGMPTNSGSSSVSIPNVVVTSASISSAATSVGQPVTVTANVVNKGNASGSAMISLYLGDRKVDGRGLTLTSGSTQPVTFTLSPDQPGTYTVLVNNVPAGSLTVTSQAGNDMVLFGAGALVLVAMAGLVYLLTRRKQSA